MSEEEFRIVLDGCLKADEAGTESRLSPIEYNQAGLVGRFARVSGGMEESIAAQGARAAGDLAHARAVEIARASAPMTTEHRRQLLQPHRSPRLRLRAARSQ